MNGITSYRKNIGHQVDIVATTPAGCRSTFHGTLLSCSSTSLWLVDGADADVIVPMSQVCELLPA
jgi:ribosome maturation factor RimP